MGLFDFFRSKSSKGYDLASIVQQMFDNANIKPTRDGDTFVTEVDGVYCTFRVLLRCNEQDNNLTIIAPFPIPIPRHVVNAVALEMERLTSQSSIEFSLNEDTDGYLLYAYNKCTFTQTPAPADIQTRMIHTIDAMDDDKFASLICAIMGYATYDELQQTMKQNAQIEGSKAHISMTDGYTPLLKQCTNLSAPRIGGRLLMFATHIIEQNQGKGFANLLLEKQTPFNQIIQSAYNCAPNEEQDVLRKLLYLMQEKRTDHDDDGDSLMGRLEAIALINADIYSLLK